MDVALSSRALLPRLLLLVVLASSTAADQYTGRSPKEQGLRPVASPDDIPEDLVEDPNRSYDPRPHELNSTMLRAKLGRNLDPNFMSISRPRDLQEFYNHSDFVFKRNRKGRLVPVGDMPRYLREMDFKFIRLPDGTKLRTRVPAKLKKKYQQFLWSFTACPVAYRWKDLGLRFWPRWFQEAHCPAGKISCSIPPGMKCRPSATEHKTILRFWCRQTVLTNAALQPPLRTCQWIKAELPVVTKCACACPGANNSYS